MIEYIWFRGLKTTIHDDFRTLEEFNKDKYDTYFMVKLTNIQHLKIHRQGESQPQPKYRDRPEGR